MAVDYYAYLASREWGLLKEQVRQRSGGQCERCHKGRHEATHHLTYEHVGEERLEELLGVCKPCHEWLGGYSDFDPLTPQGRQRSQKYSDEIAHGRRNLTPEQIAEDWEWFRERGFRELVQNPDLAHRYESQKEQP